MPARIGRSGSVVRFWSASGRKYSTATSFRRRPGWGSYSSSSGFAALIGSLIGLAPKPEGGLAGPVGIARITGAVAKTGLREYLNLTAILSLNLALINILPQWIVRVGRDLIRSLAGTPTPPTPIVPLTPADRQAAARGSQP